MTVQRQRPTGAHSNPRVIGFDSPAWVDVRAVGDADWEILRDLTYRAQRQDFVVPRQEKTDFASVPRAFVWFIPRYGRYTKAAVLHDYLWRVSVPNQVLSRRDADGIFVQAMRQLDVPFLRRWIMWTAVRYGALTKPDGRAGWWKDAWRVLPLTIVALPIVAPAALVIAVTLPVFFLMEQIVFVPLLLARKMRERKGLTAKRVNEPQLKWRL